MLRLNGYDLDHVTPGPDGIAAGTDAGFASEWFPVEDLVRRLGYFVTSSSGAYLMASR